ncbi:Two component system response regulator/histidine kinase, PAS domain-containing [Desulfonema limicola]|uniref:histidine kinase n=1 Tax=Desulfonema limicola TaxID=45656 RepID=A0A975BC04_9BACT|nr:response regulator [Desulfonema limicola]QTA82583.1 Two component system response regulator/histidine kinase, PAS domain-containing [Desulfonema limicola]
MKKKILLVDDEPGIRNTLKILIEDMGYEVVTAENGEKALETYTSFRPPVVITDIKMPGMDGIALLRTLKRRNSDIEVIMMTGHADMDLAIESLKQRATDFITKPIQDDAVEIALERAFERISIRKQLKDYTDNLESLVAEKSQKLIEAERLIAVGQAVEGLASALMGMAEDLDGSFKYFNDLPCFVSLHNSSLDILAANELFKEKAGDISGLKSWEMYSDKPENQDKCPAALTFKNQKGIRTRETFKTKNARYPVAVYTVPVRDRNGKVELVIEFAADIAEVRRLQEELETTKQRYRQLFDEVPCYITVQDRSLRIIEANRWFKETFGDIHDTDTSEKNAKFCYEIYKGREKPCQDCPVIKTFEDGKNYSCESVVRSKTGEVYNVLIWTAPIREKDGTVNQVMEMSTNITQIHKLRDQLSSLGLLIGSISHGVKGMLTGLDGGVYMLNSGFAKNDRAKMDEGWETVKLTISRIRTMILDILYYAKERELNWEQVDAFSFINETAASFEAKVHKENIEFIRDFDPELGEFEVDPGVVRSALINILENAVDACVEDNSKTSHSIIFRTKHKQDHIIFEVIDNGIGMDKETQTALFTLFFSSKGNKGTGLGMFVSKKIIEQHGGQIKVESEKGKGSCFTIIMPKKLPDSEKKTQQDKK